MTDSSQGPQGKSGPSGGAEVAKQAEALSAQLETLLDETGIGPTVQKKVRDVSKLTRRLTVGMLIAFLSIGFDIGLTVWIHNGQTRLDRINLQLTDAQCTLDGLIVASYKPDDPKARNGQTVAKYNSQIKPFFDGYRDLGCLPKLPDDIGP